MNTPPRASGRPRVLVIGCGFGGIEAVRALSRAAVEIILVDRTNHHLFQPLLYQVATAGLSAPSVSAPIRHVLRRQTRRGNLTILKAEVCGIDVASRTVSLDGGGRIDWDHLIVAAGATHSYFGHDEWEPHAPGLKTLADAFVIRSRMVGAFERAEREGDAAMDEGWLTFVVIGGGPTGVEMAGTMSEIARHTLKDEFRRIDPTRSRVILLEGGGRILTSFAPVLSGKAHAELERLGVDVRTGAKVVGIDAEGVRYDSSDGPVRIAARTVVWAAGVAGSPLGADIAHATGATLDKSGRVAVEPDLSVPGLPQVSVIGDLAQARSYPPQGEPTPVPGVSPAAKQMGRAAAANVLRRIAGKPTLPFRYRDYGNLATVGRKSAIVELEVPVVGAVRFSGFPAWLFWLFAHIWFLIGFRSRIVVMVDWAWAYFTYERGARVVAEPPRPSERASTP